MSDDPISAADDQERRIARAEELYAEVAVVAGGFDPVAAQEARIAEAEGQPPAEAESTAGGFDPGEHTVEEVQDYLAAHPDETDAVLAAEAEGKNRVTLTG